MSTDDQFRDSDAIDSPTAHSAGASAVPAAESGASDGALVQLRDIEVKPLEERAPAYQALADRLRDELEHSDPSRSAS